MLVVSQAVLTIEWETYFYEHCGWFKVQHSLVCETTKVRIMLLS